MARKKTPEDQAAEIRKLQGEGKSHAEICRDHPDLTEGWDVMTAQRPARASGATMLASAGSGAPIPD